MVIYRKNFCPLRMKKKDRVSQNSVKSPTRVDLAGGTLDCWPLYAFIGDCRTINISIDIFTSVLLELRTDSKVSVNITNLDFEKTFASKEEFMNSYEPELFLVQKAQEYYPISGNGFHVETKSESPVGGGLGGSSSLLISLLKAFSQASGVLPEIEEKVTLAKNIEAQMLKTPTGTQDYYPAAAQGLNSLHYRQSGVEHSVLDYDVDYFNSRMSLVYTGRSHHSGINNWSVIQSVVNQQGSALEVLKEINQVAHKIYEVCIKQNWDKLGPLFQQETQLRVQLSDSFVSP